MPPPQGPARIEVTRTPRAGGADTVINENRHAPDRRVLDLAGLVTQSVGGNRAALQLDDSGGRYGNAWGPKDKIVIKAEKPSGALFTVFEGYADALDPEGLDVAGGHPTLLVSVVGYDVAEFDLKQISTEKVYKDTAITTIVDEVRSGFTSLASGAITADATTTSVTLQKGWTVKQALEHLRKQLTTVTGQLWEFKVKNDAGTLRLEWYKRATTVQKTLGLVHDAASGVVGVLLDPKPRVKDSGLLQVLNRVTVQGATVPTYVLDKSSLTQAGLSRLDASGIRIGQPYKAKDNPLYAVTMRAERSLGTLPPSLKGYFARNSDNVNVLRKNELLNKAKLERANLTGTDGAINDGDQTTSESLADPGAAFVKLAVWDYGAAGVTLAASRIIANVTTAGAGYELRLSHSDDNITYTTFTTSTISTLTPSKDTIHQVIAGSDSVTKRYWKLEGRSTSAGGSCVIFEVELSPYKNLSADATNPQNLIDGLSGTSTTVAVTGAMTKELARFDFRSAQAYAKVTLEYTSEAEAGVTLELQDSADGAAWTFVGNVPHSASFVIATLFVERPSKRYLRIAQVDTRAAASAARTVTAREQEVFFQTAYVAGHKPLTGDKLLGSEFTWAVSATEGALVDSPGLLEEKTFAAPRLAQVSGSWYWLVLEPGAGVSTTSYWDASYATEAGTEHGVAQRSTDSGSTWANVAANAVLRLRLKWNNAPLLSTSEDAASQGKYGVLAGSFVDDALTTQEMVDREASVHVARRKETVAAVSVSVPFDEYVLGQRVKLQGELARRLRLSGSGDKEMDVVEVQYHPTRGIVELVLDEHFAGPEAEASALLLLSGQRRV